MTMIFSAICPCCKVEAKGDLKAIEQVFGMQAIAEGAKAQLYCTKCQAQKCTSDVKNCA